MYEEFNLNTYHSDFLVLFLSRTLNDDLGHLINKCLKLKVKVYFLNSSE